VQFIGEDIMPSDAKKFFTSIPYDLWNGIKDEDEEILMKEKIIDFLPFHVVKNAKEILSTFKGEQISLL